VFDIPLVDNLGLTAEFDEGGQLALPVFLD
jgi:hypothetical protein